MFYEIGLALYTAFTEKRPEANVPSEYKQIAGHVAAKCGWGTRFNAVEMRGTVKRLPENRKVMIALSGGLDSVYLMYKLQEQGYDVTAVHVAGLNKSSSSFEERYARDAARKAGAKYIPAKFKAPRQVFPDNPFKNQLILSIMLDIGIARGIYRYAIGSDWTTPLSEAVVGFTITDSAEVYLAFWNGVRKRFEQAELVFIPDNEKKYERLQYLFDKGALECVSSCISPLRFRESLHVKNEQKYHIKLMPGRCGSCYKCAMEYILLVEAGKIAKNPAFYAHCWDTLATSKTAHRPDLFAKSLPLEKRLRNLRNYGS